MRARYYPRMKSVRLALIAGLLVCESHGALSSWNGQSATPVRPQQATARIIGIVRSADSGQALSDASVYLSTTETGGFSRSVVTSADGRFDFQQLATGRYWIAASRPGWPRVAYGQRRPGRSGRPIDVADSQVIDDLKVNLVRGGVLTGTIFGADGEPAAYVNVAAFRYAYVDGVRQLQLVSGADSSFRSTDDRGMYRVSGLDAGEYFICLRVPRTAEAGAPSTLNSPSHTGDSAFGGDMVFYPGTSTFVDAQSVKLSSGEERTGLDVRLSSNAVTTISGTVTAPDGKTSDAILILDIEGNPNISGLRADAKADGRFLFPSVPSGSYTLTADAYFSAGAMAPMHVSVADKPIANLQLQLQPFHAMTGRVAWQDGSRPVGAARIALRDTRTGNYRMSDSRDIAADDTFRIADLFPGHYYVGVTLPPSSDWSVKSVTIAGRDTTDVPFDYDGSGDVSDVVIELTNRSSELKGSVFDADAHPAIDYTVVAFSEDPHLWNPFSRRIQASQSSQDGRFILRGLPPGDYLLAAVEDIEPGAWIEPTFLEALRANATHVHISEGEHKTQDLHIGR